MRSVWVAPILFGHFQGPGLLGSREGGGENDPVLVGRQVLVGLGDFVIVFGHGADFDALEGVAFGNQDEHVLIAGAAIAKEEFAVG